MFTLTQPTEPGTLNDLIDTMIDAMADETPGTDEYTKLAAQLIQLYKAKELEFNIQLKEIETLGNQNEKELKLLQTENDMREANRLKRDELDLRSTETTSNCELKRAETITKMAEYEDRRRVSSDTLALIAANIAGIVLIIGHERINVVTSKALSFVGKLR